MKPCTIRLRTLGALFLAAICLPAVGQTPAQRRTAQQLYAQAQLLERRQQLPQAVAKIKEALRLDPKNAWYRTYKAELEALAERAAFDRHALETPAEEEKTVAGLARYLVKPAKNDRDKARLIFRWVTDRVAYDVAALLGGKLSNIRPVDVLAKRLCVCEGYAQLYVALAREVGLEVELVRGRCKSRITGPDRKSLAHTWVAVKIEGKWQLVDPTQGAGDIDLAARRFVRRSKDYCFLTPPEKLIFTHLPRQPRWQLLPEAVGDEEFDRWGLIDARLFDFGVKVEDLRALTRDKTFKEAVEVLGWTGPRLKILTAPLRKQLQAGKRYDIEIEAPGVIEMGVAINGKLQLFARRGLKFVGSFAAPAQGVVFLAARWSPKDKGLEGFLRYAVE